MTSFAHKKIAEAISVIDQVPNEEHAFSKWILAERHLQFLASNANADEIVLYAGGPYTFIHTVAVPNAILFPLNPSDLLKWSGNPYKSIAAYVYGGGREDVRLERSASLHGSKVLDHAIDLIFGRSFEGWSGSGANYFEVNQEYTHLAGIHWRPEHNAYCCYDENGDLDHQVSISLEDDRGVTLVSLKWPKLEEYLAISERSLVRVFDLTLLRRQHFSGWGDGPEITVKASPTIFYRQKAISNAAYTRGVQVIRPRQAAADIFARFKSGRRSTRTRYVDFIAWDFRNKVVTTISTDPACTTNYFEADDNDLPFELSPAFFRAEVLSKYKTDRDKYRIRDRSVECRSAWVLEGYDVNEAGQVHAYICDLQKLPYSEQLHWAAHNEEPKASISERAHTNDFMGEFVTFRHPREEVMSIVKRWSEANVPWWTLRADDLLHRANVPLTPSRNEWADAFMDLSQLLIEGFETKAIRRQLDIRSVGYESNDQSIQLLERLLANSSGESALSLAGLRAVQRIRSKVKGHAGSSEGKQLTDAALAEHGTFAQHFNHVCALLVVELEGIERSFDRG